MYLPILMLLCSTTSGGRVADVADAGFSTTTVVKAGSMSMTAAQLR